MCRFLDVFEGGELFSNVEVGFVSEEDVEKRIEEGFEVLKRIFFLDVFVFVVGVCW